MELSWNIEGVKELSRTLQGVSLEMRDWRAPLDRAATNLMATFSGEVFSTRGGAVGTQWAPLSPATIARKARGNTPLVETGFMKSSFRKEVHATHAVIDNPTEYFPYHQSNKPRSRLPRRPMMRMGNRQKEMIQRELNKEFQNKIKRNYA